MNSSQAFSHNRMIAPYLVPHFSVSSLETGLAGREGGRADG